ARTPGHKRPYQAATTMARKYVTKAMSSPRYESSAQRMPVAAATATTAARKPFHPALCSIGSRDPADAGLSSMNPSSLAVEPSSKPSTAERAPPADAGPQARGSFDR